VGLNIKDFDLVLIILFINLIPIFSLKSVVFM